VLVREARVLGKLLQRFVASSSKLVNIGSSTGEFRTVTQPYIQKHLFSTFPGEIIHVDLKESEGVDLCADFMTDQGLNGLKSLAPDIVLASNLLEHVENPLDGLSRLGSLVAPGNLLVVCGPTRYPHHPDPIDNGFRPTSDFLPEQLPEFTTVHSRVYRGGPICIATRRTGPAVTALARGILQKMARRHHSIQKPFFQTKFYVYIGRKMV
jgi:hypothetical protein